MAQVNREIFRAVSEYDNYEVSNHGRVRNVITGKILKAFRSAGGYQRVTLIQNGERKHHSVHRLVASEFIDNPDDKTCVDHIDGDPSNNNVSNLRWATYTQNNQNTKKKQFNTTGYKGVCYEASRMKYKASIRHNDKHICIGRFDTAEEAHEAYKRKARELFGEFARFE